MKKQIFFFILLSLFYVVSFAQSRKVNQKIVAAMHQQEKAWNAGDIEGYMAYYWNSDSLKFIGKSGITYGWKSTTEHYKKSYPDAATMGKLTFGDIKTKKLSCRLVMVTGSWKLERAKGNLEGFYSLIWKRIKGKWFIIVDHTS